MPTVRTIRAALGLSAAEVAPLAPKFALLVSLVLLQGCGSIATKTAGVVDCSPQEMTFSNYHSGLNDVTWTAYCRGRTYNCWRSSFSRTQCREAGH